MRGASGQALLFLRLYERCHDPAYLDAAEAAIAADLDRCVTDHKGSLQVDDGWRTLPYLDAGYWSVASQRETPGLEPSGR